MTNKKTQEQELHDMALFLAENYREEFEEWVEMMEQDLKKEEM